MEAVFRVTGPTITAIVVREKIKGHWYYHARSGRIARGGNGDPIEGSGSFSRASCEHHAREHVIISTVRDYVVD